MNRVVLVKLQPNQDLLEGLEAACAGAGLTAGLILSGVGSLNDAWFVRNGPGEESSMLCIEGPGLELAGITGELVVGASGGSRGQTRLIGWVTRTDGSVVGGPLARGRNIICITFEFTILEWSYEQRAVAESVVELTLPGGE